MFLFRKAWIVFLAAAASPLQASAGGFGWTLSASSTDPYLNQTPWNPVPTYYLWLVCSESNGLSAAEFGLNLGFGTLLSKTSENGFIDGAAGTDFLLTHPSCPSGPIVAAQVTINFFFGPTSVCFVPRAGAGIASLECGSLTLLPINWIGVSHVGSPCRQGLLLCCATDYVSYYSLDGSTADLGCAMNNGTAMGGGFSTDACASPGKAFAFGGSDWIDCGDVLNDLALPLSVSLWMNSSDPDRGLIHSEVDSTTSVNSGFWIEIVANKLETGYGSGQSGPNGARTLRSSVQVPADTWVHVVAVLRGPTDMDLYQDGVQVGASYSGSGGALTSGPGHLNFGRAKVGGGADFMGSVDEIKIFDRSLSPAEVASLFSEGPCGVTSAPEVAVQARDSFVKAVTPNPFRETVSLLFELTRRDRVKIEIFDAHGRRVRLLEDGSRSAGTHTVSWHGYDTHGRPAAPGVYFFRVRTGITDATRTVVRLN